MDLAQLKKIASFYARYTPSFSGIGYVARGLAFSRPQGDFSGQRWLITGASGGIGSEIARDAASRGARVIAVARSAEKLAAMRAEHGEAGSRIEPLVCDLSLQRDVERMLGELAAAADRINVLVNSVGVLLDDYSLSDEGRESSFAINILNHYLLTEGLIKRKLLAADALVINISSGGMYNVPLSTAMLNITDPASYNGTFSYGFAKRAQVVLSQYWQRKYGASGLSSYVMHPGWVDTDGVKRSLPRFRRILRPVLRGEAAGADTVIWLACERPQVPDEDHIWFDRKARTAHIFERTRVSEDTPQTLVAFLEAELERVRR